MTVSGVSFSSEWWNRIHETLTKMPVWLDWLPSRSFLHSGGKEGPLQHAVVLLPLLKLASADLLTKKKTYFHKLTLLEEPTFLSRFLPCLFAKYNIS